MRNDGKVRIEWLIVIILVVSSICFCLFLRSRATSAEMVNGIRFDSLVLMLSVAGVSVSILRFGHSIRLILAASRRQKGVGQRREQERARRAEVYQRREWSAPTKDYFSESNLTATKKQELNAYVEKSGLHRVVLYENTVECIARKLLELGEKDFHEEAYCYFGVADREEKWILTRYAKEKVDGQENNYKEKYIVFSHTEQEAFQAALLEGETDVWGNWHGSYKITADNENISGSIQEFIMPAIMYLNKADGYEELMDKIEETFQMFCSEYKQKNYEKVLQYQN